MKLTEENIIKMGLTNTLHSDAEVASDFIIVRVTKTYCSSSNCTPHGSHHNGSLVHTIEDRLPPTKCPYCGSTDRLHYKSKRVKRSATGKEITMRPQQE